MARPRIHDETGPEQQLLEVSSEIIAEHGAAALSMRKVATAAGTTTAAIYALFGSREALIEAVVIEGFTRFAEQLQSVVHTDDPAADLRAGKSLPDQRTGQSALLSSDVQRHLRVRHHRTR